MPLQVSTVQHQAFLNFVVFHSWQIAMSYPSCSREKGARALGMVGKMATSHTGFSPPSDPNSNSRSRTSPDEENPRLRGGSQGRVAAMSTIVTNRRAQSASQPRPHVTHPDTTSPSTDDERLQRSRNQALARRARSSSRAQPSTPMVLDVSQNMAQS